ncbi:hypothetical protein BOO30_19230 [Vibrio navarrensis]|uniref:restriction endonuclease n=1 Tax=Vibrio navarrensis TaxID=29495 RepID=UPI0018698958|nr:restriction endonuclease [Vibrio navarrensis]MBE4579694.1 hypothetical protein [Vibrio navarrensis]MBE4598489.1 hypothetical protein [Vibrio navarrensis]
MKPEKEMTGYEYGLSGDAQIALIVKYIAKQGRACAMKELYTVIEEQMNGAKLSAQGKATLRFFVNRVAVNAGLIFPYDKSNPGWRLTAEGISFASVSDVTEETINEETQQSEIVLSNSARGLAFEHYTLKLLKLIYPSFIWHHQGLHKLDERGLDFIGDRLGELNSEISSIGVQVKFHKENSTPTQTEWLKFLSGCFARRVSHAIFITTGRLSSAQYREAREANVLVIQGVKEIKECAKKYNLEKFELF